MDKRLMTAEHKRGSLSVGLMLLVNSLQQHSCCLFVDLAELVVYAGCLYVSQLLEHVCFVHIGEGCWGCKQ